MRYVTPELLARSLKALSDYSSTKDEKIKALFGIFVLKRQGVELHPRVGVGRQRDEDDAGGVFVEARDNSRYDMTT